MAQGNIPSYDPTMPGVRVDETGVESAAQAANRINRIYTEVGSNIERTGHQVGAEIGGGIRDLGQAVEDSMYHKELSHGVATDAQILQGLTQQWTTALQTADPHDATLGARFMQGPVQEALDKFQKGFTTERGIDWVTRRSQDLLQHFSAVTAHGAGELAGKAAVADVGTLSNSLTNTVYQDPGQLPFLMRSIDAHVGDIVASYPGLQGENLATVRETLPKTLKQNLIKSAAVSAILGSPDEATAQTIATRYASDPRYKDYIDGKELTQFVKIAAADQRARNELQRQAEKQKAFARTDQYITDAASDNPQLSLKSILTDPAYQGRPDLRDEAMKTFETMRKFRTEQASVPPEVSHATTLRLISGLTAPQGDPSHIADRSPIDKEFQLGHIDKQDYLFALSQAKAINDPDEKPITRARTAFFKSYSTAFSDDTSQYAATQEAIRQEAILKAKGEDPQSLYDPNSKNFFGDPKNIARFQTSLWGKIMGNTPTGAFASPEIEKYATAMKSGLESHGDYAAVGPATSSGDHAYGAYQVMGANVPSWTAKYYGRSLTAQEFLGNKTAQDLVFSGEFSRLVKLYGPEGAARAWYAGEESMNDLKRTAHTPTGAPLGMTVGDYGAKFATLAGVPRKVPEAEIVRLAPGTIYTAPDGTLRRRRGPTIPGSQ